MTTLRRRRLQWCCGLAVAGALALAGCGDPPASVGGSDRTSPPPATAVPRSAPPSTSVAPRLPPTVPAPSPVATTQVAAAAATPTTAQPAPVRSGSNVNDADSLGDPLALTIASIGVDTPLVSTGVLADGTVAVPIDPNIAGWYTGGPRPGELGPAVIMGHLDSKKSGPGVFWRLRDLAVGAEAVVHAERGDIRFVVTAREQVPKAAFPTQRVYGAVPERALRLITCGGSFDRSIGHYRDNVVVYLVAVSS